MKKIISIILCTVILVTMFTVGAFAQEEETTSVTVSQEELEENPSAEEPAPEENDFDYSENLWLAFQNATMVTVFFPEMLIATLLFGIAGPFLSFAAVGYSYAMFFKAIAGVPVDEDYCITFKDGWKEIERLLGVMV